MSLRMMLAPLTAAVLGAAVFVPAAAVAESMDQRPAAPTPSSAAMPQTGPQQVGAPRPMQGKLEAAKPDDAAKAAAAPQRTAIGAK
ncbi:MAG: hypothetical protein QOG83_873 [Alphaproteobacteria bacterium]|nr:hypothetical protein [Alphaproteobacteria bacterium]